MSDAKSLSLSRGSNMTLIYSKNEQRTIANEKLASGGPDPRNRMQAFDQATVRRLRRMA
jgi:hypothetical protein